jgi:hypothetical protein
MGHEAVGGEKSCKLDHGDMPQVNTASPHGVGAQP